MSWSQFFRWCLSSSFFFHITVVTVSFDTNQYVFSESDGSQRVYITVNRPVARDFTVRLSGGELCYSIL